MKKLILPIITLIFAFTLTSCADPSAGSGVPVFLSDVKRLSAGEDYTVAIKDDGILYAWGRNEDGQLGDGSNTEIDIPVQLSAAQGPDGIPYKDYKWKAVSAGAWHTAAIREDNTIWAWGENWAGQLGNVNSSMWVSFIPVQLSADNGPDNIPYKNYKWKTVSVGYGHTAAIREDNTIWVWGYNANGQLGDGSTTSRFTPVQLPETNGPDNIPYKNYKWKAVSAGREYTIAIREDNTIWVWGKNANGQLGDGTKTDRLTPVQLPETNGPDNIPYKNYKWKAVSTGDNYTVAIREDNTLWAWGNNNDGQLGDGSSQTDRLTPVKVGDRWREIYAGDRHTVAIKIDGVAWAWGYNKYGQLGNATRKDSLTPVRVILSGW